MDTLYVFKVKFTNTLRRIAFPNDLPAFDALEKRVRAQFKVPADVHVALTYTDVEGDVITLATDEDVMDAMVYQKLNPLLLDVSIGDSAPVVEAFTPAAPQPARAAAPAVPPVMEESVRISEAPEAVKSVEAPAPAVEKPEALEAPKLAAAAAAAETSHPKNSTPFSATLRPEEEKIAEVIRLVDSKIGEFLSGKGQAAEALDSFKPLLESVPQHVGQLLSSLLDKTEGLRAHAPAAAAAAAAAAVTPARAAASSPVPGKSVAKESEAPAGASKPAPVTPAPGAAAKPAEEAAKPVHHGIVCDVCETNPIVGLRYRSTVKHDYDLCEKCFKKHGVEGHYEALDRPKLFRPSFRCYSAARSNGSGGVQPLGMGARQCFSSRPHQSFGGSHGYPYRHPMFHGQDVRGAGQHGHQRLDSRFVSDVTVFDGTQVAPRMRFTKIWRIRNCGNVPWPSDLQVLRLGGDRLADVDVVPVELPPGGVPPEAELNVAVEMVAPAEPGRYTSHWRLQTSSGYRFGHRFWALIHVEDERAAAAADAADSAADASAAVNTVDNLETAEPVQKVADGGASELKGEAALPSIAVEEVKAEVAAAAAAVDAADEEEEDPIVAAVRAAAVSLPPAVKSAAASPTPSVPSSVVELTDALLLQPPTPAEPIIDEPAAVSDVAAAAEVVAAAAVPASVSAQQPAAEEATSVGKFSILDMDASSSSTPSATPSVAASSAASSADTPNPTPMRMDDFFNDFFTGYPTVGVPSEPVAAAAGGPAGAAAKPAGVMLDDMFGDEDGYVMAERTAADTAAAAAAAAKTRTITVYDSEDEVEEVEMEKPKGEREGEERMMEALLQQMQAMGFPHRGLNEQLLRAGQMTLDAAVDELVKAEQWQAQLDDLEEMGFTDKEENLRVLLRHKGSLRSAVKDMVAAAKADMKAAKKAAKQAGKGKAVV